MSIEKPYKLLWIIFWLLMPNFRSLEFSDRLSTVSDQKVKDETGDFEQCGGIGKQKDA
jgi:hypothetical protein